MTNKDYLAHYKRGYELGLDMEKLGDFGTIDNETGQFIFRPCDCCGGPKFGHLSDECNVKPKMKKDTKEMIENLMENEPSFSVSLAKADKRPGLSVCNLCRKQFGNRYDLEVHMRFDEKKTYFRSHTNILASSDKSNDGSSNEYMKGLNEILERMIEKKDSPNVTQNTKARPPPSWTKKTFEC